MKHMCQGGEQDRISHTPKLQGNTGAPRDAQRYTKREKELSPQLHFVYKFNRTLSRGRSGTLAYHVQALSSSPSNWLATSLLGYGSVVTSIPGVGHREDKQKIKPTGRLVADVHGSTFAHVFVCLHYVLAAAACKRHHYQNLKN